MPQIQLKNITKRFGKFVAVDKLNLVIGDGDFVTLLGPSGCGKTTTLRMIAGLETPTEGEICIDGRVVFSSEKGIDIAPDKRDVGFLFQNYALWPHMTVYQNIAFGLENLKWSREKIRERVSELLAMLKIVPFEKRYPSELSGGQQQRVALARAIVNKPRVLLFDEPLSNLDAKLRETMRVEIRRIQQTFGITSVYVTHDQAEAMTVSDRIVVMEKGLVMQVGAPFEIYSRPKSRFVADFIGKVNLFPVTVAACGGEPLVRDALGREFAAGSVDPDLTAGDEAFLALRPESLRLGAASGKPFGEGRVTKAVYLGSVIEYEIDAGYERPLLALSYDPVDGEFYRMGDRVAFSFPRRAAHVLPLR